MLCFLFKDDKNKAAVVSTENTTSFTLQIERSIELDCIVIFEVISSLVLG